MHDERWEPGMPVLDRQAAPSRPARTTELPPSLRGLPARSVPETAPTPLQRHYINLSVIALVAGAIAITALELGAPIGSPIVKLGVLVAAPIIVATTADAALRIWRSAMAWMPVDRGKAWFRIAWLGSAAVFIAVTIGLAFLVLRA